MSVSIAALKFVACIAMITLGAICLIHSIRGKEFYYGHLLSRKPNERAPAWFSRPLFFVMGLFWIYAAVGYRLQELWPPR
jgi:hypothetical protein